MLLLDDSLNNPTENKSLLKSLLPASRSEDLDDYYPYFAPALDFATITTPNRLAMFLAQLGHESSDLRFREEIWRNTPTQQRYEPPSRLAVKLGNINKGDGYKYRGRGPFQLSGRANYRLHGKRLNLNLEEFPDLAALPEFSLLIAADYWKRMSLNNEADAYNLIAATRKINGGLNGYHDRLKRYLHCCKTLHIDLSSHTHVKN